MKNNQQQTIFIEQKLTERRFNTLKDKEIIIGVNHKKFRLLEDRAHFIEGQLNPLYSQNLVLKQQIISMNKLISQTTNMLRSLLPIHDRKGNLRKLQVTTGNIEDIREIIRKDWIEINEENMQMKQKIEQLNGIIIVLKEQIQQTNKNYRQQVLNLQSCIADLSDKLKFSNQRHSEQIKKIQGKHQQLLKFKDQLVKQKINQIQQLKRYFSTIQSKLDKKQLEYNNVIKRHKDDIENLFNQFEQSKKNLTLLFEKKLKQKQDELNNLFNIRLKLRDQQMEILILQHQTKEQENKKKMMQKIDQINTLNNEVNNLNKQINITKQQIWDLTNKLEILSSKNKDLEYKIQNWHIMKKQLQQKILEQQKVIEFYKQKILELQESHKNQKNQVLQQNEKLKNESKLQKQIYQKNKKKYESKIFNLITESEEIHKDYNSKIKYKQREWKQKLQEVNGINHEINEKIKKKQKEILDITNKIHQKQIQLQKKQKQFKSQIQTINKEFAQEKSNIYKQESKKRKQVQQLCQKRIQGVESYFKQKFEDESKEYKKKILNYEKQKIILKKQKQDEIEKIKFNHSNQLSKIKNETQQQKKQIKKKLQENEQQFKTKLQSQHKQLSQKINRLEKQYQTETKSLNRKIQNQITNSQNNLKKLQQSFQLIKSELIDKFLKEIKQIKLNYESQIQQLKSLNNIDQLQKKHKKYVQKLLKQNQNAIKLIIQKHQQQLQRLKQKLNQQIIKLNQQHQSLVVQITNRLQSDLTKINDLLLSEKQSHTITKMTKQQRIQYLSGKIMQFKQKMNNLEITNLSLKQELIKNKNELFQLQKTFENRMKYKIEQLKSQLTIQLRDKEKQCSLRIKQKQRENIKFANQLNQEFLFLQKLHQQQIENWQAKFRQLQDLFLQRPSRPEDLSAIKDLLEQKQQLARMVQEAELKVKRANQILKYLQLQLCNYKQTYDMFGPNQPQSPQYQLNKRMNSISQSPGIKKFRIKSIKTQQDQQNTNIEFQPLEIVNKEKILPPLIRLNSIQINQNPQGLDDSQQIIVNAQKFLSALQKKDKYELITQQSPSNNYAPRNRSRRKIKQRNGNELSILQMMSKKFKLNTSN